MNRSALLQYLDSLLNPSAFDDYCPNGLQVEGKEEIQKIVTGVSASLDLIETALSLNADALLVHHGYFWKNESSVITGIKKRRLEKLLSHNVNLIAYHLPLDVHPEIGNNAQLAKLFGWNITETASKNNLLFLGNCKKTTPQNFAQNLKEKLNRAPLQVGENKTKSIHRIAWCTGAAQDFLNSAAALGVDAFISGEISERTAYEAKELGIYYFSIGHHASERYGIKALGDHLQKQFNIECPFVDCDNPV